MQGGEEVRSEAYLDVRCSDERRSQRRRWAFFSSLLRLPGGRGGGPAGGRHGGHLPPRVHGKTAQHLVHREGHDGAHDAPRTPARRVSRIRVGAIRWRGTTIWAAPRAAAARGIPETAAEASSWTT